jgi:hypothetical protein
MVIAAELAQLAIDLSKATFDNLYFSADTLQTLAERRVSALVHAVCPAGCALPGLVDEWTGLLQRTRTDLKRTVDRCVQLVEVVD